MVCVHHWGITLLSLEPRVQEDQRGYHASRGTPDYPFKTGKHFQV